jgi:fimbrial chaperone protein
MTMGCLCRILAVAFWTIAGIQAMAGEFSVNPIRVDLGPTAKSAVITVTNEGNEKLNFQIQGMEWSQNAAGKDEYRDTRELIFFPKIMSVEPGREGVIRIGLRAQAVAAEKTYRLFIEEMPGIQKEPQTSGAQIKFLIRFGVPVFAAPGRPADGLAVDGFELKNGVIALFATNMGNRHQVVKGIHLKGMDSAGKAIYGLDIADRYLLAGTRKSYTATVAAEQCRQITVLDLEIKTDKLSETRRLDVTPAMCP